MTSHADVVIVGAGPAGCAAALLLRKGGASVLMVDREAKSVERIETLSPQGRHLLDALQLIQVGTYATKACPGTVSLWHDAKVNERSHLQARFGDAIHIERSNFDATLLAEALAAGARLAPFRETDELGKFKSKFTIFANGRNSRCWGTPRHYFNDRICLAGHLVQEFDDNRMYIETLDDCWLYGVNKPGQGSLVSVSMSAQHIPCDASLRLRLWKAKLEKSRLLRRVLDNRFECSRLDVLDARSSAAAMVGGKNWVAIGDARFAFDFLSGQGLHSALEDALIASAHFLKGESKHVAGYLCERSFEQWQTQALAIKQFYG